METICRKCPAVLMVGVNWWPSNQKINKRICNNCVNKAMRPVWRKARKKLKFTAFTKVGGSSGVKCVYCGCDDIRLLEINHKNGGGRHDAFRVDGDGPERFHRDIVAGRRKVDDLELTCRPCNARYYLEMKYGPLPFTIMWSPKSEAI